MVIGCTDLWNESSIVGPTGLWAPVNRVSPSSALLLDKKVVLVIPIPSDIIWTYLENHAPVRKTVVDVTESISTGDEAYGDAGSEEEVCKVAVTATK